MGTTDTRDFHQTSALETCVWCKGKTPSRWSWIPLKADTPIFVWRSSPTSITELGQKYQSHVLNSKRFWKRQRIKDDQMNNCWWRHFYEKKWKWAWSNYISTVMFCNSIFVLEQKKERLVKTAVGHPMPLHYRAFKKSLSPVSPFVLLCDFLLGRPQHPPSVLLLQLLYRLPLPPDLKSPMNIETPQSPPHVFLHPQIILYLPFLLLSFSNFSCWATLF